MKKQNKIKFLLSAIIILSFTLGFATIQNKNISAWLTYWDIKNSISVLTNNFSDKINEVNLFFYALDKDGNIINTAKEQEEYKRVVDMLGRLDIKIVPTITNDIIYSKTEKKLKDPKPINRILNDWALRQKHIQQIIEIIEEINASGVDIDYERIDIKDKDIFNQFIKELSVLLHGKNKTLNVTVQQKTEDHQRSGAGALDWKEISKYANRITIMCYNYSSKITKPGPICPYLWLEDIIEFAKTQIPIEKISIALALHGYDWSKDEINSLDLKRANSLIDEYNAELKWHRESQAPYFSYNKNGIKHTVWFENEKSIEKKLRIIRKYRIQHLGFWHLGILSPSLSKPLKSFLK